MPKVRHKLSLKARIQSSAVCVLVQGFTQTLGQIDCTWPLIIYFLTIHHK